MIQLKNITFYQYLCLKDRTVYDYAINYANKFSEAKDVLNIGDFTQLPFGVIKDLQYDMDKGILWDKMLDYMVKFSNKEVEFFYKMKLIDIIRFKNYIVESIKKIIEIESIALAYDPSEEEIAAGIEKLNVYGVYNQLLSVAGNDSLKIPEVRKMKYEDAFVYLCYIKDQSDFERRLMKLRLKND